MLNEIQDILNALSTFFGDMTSEHKLILGVVIVAAILVGCCFRIFLNYKKTRDLKKLEAENSLKLEQQKAQQAFELEKYTLDLIHKK